MNHSKTASDNLIKTGMALDVSPEVLKALCRSQYGCSVGQLSETQAVEFAAKLPELVSLVSLKAPQPGGDIQSHANSCGGEPGKTYRCDQCGREAEWNAGAGRPLCSQHWDSY
jgi:hypothetical protein